MKWYFAINEEGARTNAGLLARLAVISAQRHTNLKPHLLYRGERTRLTAWMEDRGVTVIDVLPRFEPALRQAITDGRYPAGLTGHWLRAELCNIEDEDPFVLYTDIDVVVLKPIDLTALRPRLFACAPETNQSERTHFSAGVMLMNVAAMRAEYPRLRETIERWFADPTKRSFTDQDVYNALYGGQHDPLDLAFNWKPYWELNADISIFHFHGPKLHVIRMMLDDKWNWDDPHGRFAGEMVVGHFDNYLHYLRLMNEYTEPSDRLRDILDGLLRDADAALPRLRARWRQSAEARAGAGQAAPVPSPAPWVAEGSDAWRRNDRGAFVVRASQDRWLGALHNPRPDQPNPAFITDAMGRIRHFVSAEEAQAACDAVLDAGPKKSGSAMGMAEPKGGPG